MAMPVRYLLARHRGSVVGRSSGRRGLDIARGALYVAEAGRGGPTCLPRDQATCVGLTSSVTRVGHGR